MPTIGARPNRGISGTSAKALKIVATLNIAGDSAGTKNRRSEFSIPIIAAATASMVRNGSMIRVSWVVSSSLPGTRRELPGRARMRDLRREDDPEHDQRSPVTTSSAFMTRLPSRQAASRPLRGERAGERRDERRRHRPFGEQVAQQVGDPERDVERVHLHARARAEDGRQDRLASDAEQPAGHGRERRSGRRTSRVSSSC